MGHEDRGSWDWEDVPQPPKPSALERIAKLEKALLKYARHSRDCSRYGVEQCTCGFAAMIRDAFASDAPFGICPKCRQPITSFHNINGCPQSDASGEAKS
jgi:hypothetical protein